MPNNRRFFIKSSLLGALSLVIDFFKITPGFSSEKSDNYSKTVSETLDELFHEYRLLPSDKISIKLPTIAEDGAVVPISISSELNDIERIYVLVENNPKPLTAEFYCSKSVVIQISARIKMAESSNVMVIAKVGSQLLLNKQWVNVVQGGCGTG